MATPVETPAVPQLPATYKQLYAQQSNNLNGHYATFYAAFHATTANTPDELFDTVISSTQRIPKILLARVRMPDHTSKIITLHRPSMFEQDLVEPAPTWNDRAIAFLSDIDPNSRFLETTIFARTL